MKGQQTQQPDRRTQRKNSHNITNKGTRQNDNAYSRTPSVCPTRTDLRSKVSAEIVETYIKYDTFVSLKPETGWIFRTEKSRYKSKNNKSCQGFACKFILTLTSRFFSVTKKRGVSVRPQCRSEPFRKKHINASDNLLTYANESLFSSGMSIQVNLWRLLSFLF